MEERQSRGTLMEALSFGRTPASTAEVDAGDDFSWDEIEFEFASVESEPGDSPGLTADEIFSHGRILPVYPVFNQDLVAGVLEQSEEEELAKGMRRLAVDSEKRGLGSGSASSTLSISSEAEDLNRMHETGSNFCAWTPRSAPHSPEHWRKSSSTGSSSSPSRRWRLRDLVVGRSRSDGKEKLVAVPVPEEKNREKTRVFSRRSDGESAAAVGKGRNSAKGKAGGAVKEMDIVTAHRIFYSKGGAGAGRRSFLPYRQELLVGFFGNGGQTF
ncbi:hypothetical protein AXF42_Ash012859 [Apostasia shenzhenica]|uniref:Uncharacterized protein n=1 Tax=Apostasia shenzhenica TaxID=1088818 RepID=A0A2I0AME9_9ASPA|nr:hypothetical protein AXF42_Ash012859 [Apostasia shenzhenica]